MLADSEDPSPEFCKSSWPWPPHWVNSGPPWWQKRTFQISFDNLAFKYPPSTVYTSQHAPRFVVWGKKPITILVNIPLSPFVKPFAPVGFVSPCPGSTLCSPFPTQMHRKQSSVPLHTIAILTASLSSTYKFPTNPSVFWLVCLLWNSHSMGLGAHPWALGYNPGLIILTVSCELGSLLPLHYKLRGCVTVRMPWNTQ